MRNKRIKKYRFFLVMLICAGLIAIAAVYYTFTIRRIPTVIYLQANQENRIDYSIPVKGSIYCDTIETGSFNSSINNRVIDVDFEKPVVIHANSARTYQTDLKLWGILPYKNVKIEVVDEKYVMPMGTQIGIYVKMDGILVIDTGSFMNHYGVECAPSEGILEPGDYILSVNGEEIQKKAELTQLINKTEGEAIDIILQRGDMVYNRTVYPQQDVTGEWKAGIWIRDSIQGIGTLTYIDEDGEFAALGHGINDGDVNELVKVNYGNIYMTRIVAVQKGESGDPGGITGIIEYTRDNILGDIECNTTSGIRGYYNEVYTYSPIKALPVGYRQEVHEGKAQILCALTGEQKLYDVEITEINNDNDNKKREIALLVTDTELLDITGGIVQGMSGSPIIQDGKLIGAVTHVMVRDPKRGYGIFVENMLNVR